MAISNLYIFRKNGVVCHQRVPKCYHCSANFQPILDCFTPKFKLKYDYLENIKTDHVNTVIFNLLQIKQSKLFWGHPVNSRKFVLSVSKTVSNSTILCDSPRLPVSIHYQKDMLSFG